MIVSIIKVEIMKRLFSLKILTVLMLILAVLTKTTAEDYQVPLSIGAYAGLNFNMHSPNFAYQTTSAVAGPSALFFDKSSTTSGLAIGGIFLIPLNNIFVLSGRIGYNQLSGTLDQVKSYSKVVINTSTVLDQADVNQTLTAGLHFLELSPVLQFHNLLPLKKLYFLAGLEFGIPISAKYTLEETIRDPQGLVKTEYVTVKDNAPLENASFRAALIFGAGYILHLNENVNFTPEVSFRLPFTNVSSNLQFDKWNVPQLRIGVNLTFSLEKKKAPEPAVEAPPEIKVGFKEVRYYDNEGKNYILESIKVEDVQYTELFPLVPYIFMEENKPSPSDDAQVLAGKSERGEFSIQKLEPDAIKINKSTLDIIGARMRDLPGSELTITGTNDMKKEAKNKGLALERAEFAKQYLQDNYKINEERVNIRTTNLPDKPSASTVEDGVEENRRIEFASSNPKILEPIIIESENQRLAEPNLIEFLPFVKSKDSIVSWKMEISQSDKILRKNTGTGAPPPAMQWGIHPNELTNRQIPIDYRLSVTSASGLSKDANGTIPVEYLSTTRKKSEVLPDKTISKYSLILFDFDKAEVSDADKQIVEKYIIPAIKFNSTVKIYGYTDRIGDESYNQKLAERRAIAVKELLEQKIKSGKIEVYGVGEGVLIYDNDVPSGRQLSRTVQVHVITPK